MTEKQIRAERCIVGWKKIALYLDSSVSTVKRWHRKKKLPIAITPGGAPAVFPEDLKKWLLETE